MLKREPSIRDRKIHKFLLEQQLPEARVASLGPDGQVLLTNGNPATTTVIDDTVEVAAVDHVTQVLLETCRCTHLQEHLPHILDLELCKAVGHPRGWVVANPVHSMHLQSQLEDSVPLVLHNKNPPNFYGEEQQRTSALNTEGIVEYWCPLDGYSAIIHDDTAMEKMEHMPTLQNIHKPPTQPLYPTHSTITTTSSLQPTVVTTTTATSSSTSTPIHPNSFLAPSSSTAVPATHPQPTTVPSSSSITTTTTTTTTPGAAVATPTTAPAASATTTTSITPSNTVVSASVVPSRPTNPTTNPLAPPTATSPSKQLDSKQTPTTLPNATATMDKPQDSTLVNDTTTRSMAPPSERMNTQPETTTPVVSQTPATTTTTTTTTPAATTTPPTTTTTPPTTNQNQQTPGKDATSTMQEEKAQSKDSQSPIQAMPTTGQTPSDSSLVTPTETNQSSATEQKGVESVEESKSVLLPNEQKTKVATSSTLEQETENANGENNDIQNLTDKKESEDDTTMVVPENIQSEKKELDATIITSDAKMITETENNNNNIKNPGGGAVSGQSSASPSINNTDAGNSSLQKDNTNATPMELDTPTKSSDKVVKGENLPLTDNLAPTPVVSSSSAASTTDPIATTSGSAAASATFTIVSKALTTEANTSAPGRIPSQPQLLLQQENPRDKFNHWRREEDRIRLIRHSLSSHRIVPKKKPDAKKKRKRDDFFKTSGIPGFTATPPKQLTLEQEEQWTDAMLSSRAKVALWMDNYRMCRETYWSEREQLAYAGASTTTTFNHKSSNVDKEVGSFFLPTDSQSSMQCCTLCQNKSKRSKYWEGTGKGAAKPRRRFSGDDLMQCLECNFIGCSPQSVTPDSRQHILQHLLLSGHKFAVSCGEKGRLFCFGCGDFVHHELFENEKARIDYTQQLPLMAWKHHAVYRSFDPYQFIKTEDHGIVWRGLIATYPQLVPQEHVRATEMAFRRQALLRGFVNEKWLANKPNAMRFAATQCLQRDSLKYSIMAPVGIYNLGNTCFESSVLQCLVHCKPLQRYFLREGGHPYHSCFQYRFKEQCKKKKKKREDMVCLACELDKLFLMYFGSAIGKDVRGAVDEACSQSNNEQDVVSDSLEQGDPLIITEMLTSSWKSSGMSNLAGYKQHDAHEFLNAFLGLMGVQAKKHWDRVYTAINAVRNDSSIAKSSDFAQQDIVKTTFEGSLNSVLLCEECGNKRKRKEEFLNVSLSLSDKVVRLPSPLDASKMQLTLEACLDHFVSPEDLGDAVVCPSCAKKTPTKKQHTFATLPKVLCLHLKRFDAAQNKKIDEFVSFPSHGLNMGKFLAQWCEVTSVKYAENVNDTEPQILYDLFGTVNHVGSMQSGHYVSNVKVNNRWYYCNDAHVSLAGGNGSDSTVLNNEGAYILFYVRRQANNSTEAVA